MKRVVNKKTGKSGFVRLGQEKPFIKTTNKEMRERTLAVVVMLSRGATKMEVHRACENNWGVCWRTADRYVASAREQMAEAANKSRQDMITEAYNFYASMLRSDDRRIAMEAQRGIRDLFALDTMKAQEHRLSGPNGEALPMAPVQQVSVIIVDNHRGDLVNADNATKQACIEAPAQVANAS